MTLQLQSWNLEAMFSSGKVFANLHAHLGASAHIKLATVLENVTWQNWNIEGEAEKSDPGFQQLLLICLNKAIHAQIWHLMHSSW